MRKTKLIMLTAAATAALLAGCSPKDVAVPAASAVQENGTAAEAPAAKLTAPSTMGEAFSIESNESQMAFTEGTYVYVYKHDGAYYRVTASLPEEVSKQLFALDMDDSYQSKTEELVSALPVDTFENLSEAIPPQEELDKLIGKTGRELEDEGWKYWGCDLETMEFNMEHGPFAYIVRFDGQAEMTEDFDEAEAAADLKVLSVTFDGIGDATNL